MSDVVWQALIAGVVTLILAWMQHRASQKVEQVRETLEKNTIRQDDKLDGIAKVGEDTHDLCNSAMLEQKHLYMIKCKEAAIESGKESDRKEAERAEEVYLKHKAKQEQMDAKKP